MRWFAATVAILLLVIVGVLVVRDSSVDRLHGRSEIARLSTVDEDEARIKSALKPSRLLDRRRERDVADGAGGNTVIAVGPPAVTANERLGFHGSQTEAEPHILEEPTAKQRPTRVRPQRRGFRNLWKFRGLCQDETMTSADSSRARLLDEFVRHEVDGANIFLDPAVSTSALKVMERLVLEAHGIVSTLFGVDAPRVDIYFYRDAALLRASSCINEIAVAFYDGDIHISGDLGFEQLRKNVIHEYTHHALNSAGVELPMWLQEGGAMYAAEETWWMHSEAQALLYQGSLPLDEMVWAFPHGVDQDFAVTVYVQAITMVRMVVDLEGEKALADLVDALTDGTIEPMDALAWATEKNERQLQSLWGEVIADLRPDN